MLEQAFRPPDRAGCAGWAEGLRRAIKALWLQPLRQFLVEFNIGQILQPLLF
jgi:hypothetical protein